MVRKSGYRGTRVLEFVNVFSKASGKDIPIVYASRRDGDIACSYACPDLAQQLLGWRAQRDLNDMCNDTWKWQSRNPLGYEEH